MQLLTYISATIAVLAGISSASEDDSEASELVIDWTSDPNCVEDPLMTDKLDGWGKHHKEWNKCIHLDFPQSAQGFRIRDKSNGTIANCRIEIYNGKTCEGAILGAWGTGMERRQKDGSEDSGFCHHALPGDPDPKRSKHKSMWGSCKERFPGDPEYTPIPTDTPVTAPLSIPTPGSPWYFPASWNSSEGPAYTPAPTNSPGPMYNSTTTAYNPPPASTSSGPASTSSGPAYTPPPASISTTTVYTTLVPVFQSPAPTSSSTTQAYTPPPGYTLVPLSAFTPPPGFTLVPTPPPAPAPAPTPNPANLKPGPIPKFPPPE